MPAQIPTSFGHELRACLRCRLVKTYDQVVLPFCISHYSLLLSKQFLFSLYSSENQAVRTAHFLRWKKIMSVLLIAQPPILMGLSLSIFYFSKTHFTSEFVHGHADFVFLLPFNFATGSFQLWIQLGVGLPVGCVLVCSFFILLHSPCNCSVPCPGFQFSFPFKYVMVVLLWKLEYTISV